MRKRNKGKVNMSKCMFERKAKFRILDKKIGLIYDESLNEKSKSVEDLFSFCKQKFDILGFSSQHINFMIGEKEYVLKISEVKNGEHWSEKV